MNIEIARLRDSWDAYVTATAPDSLYHRWVWRDVIQETFGHNPYYLTAVENGTIRGILPLFSIRSLLFGNSLISVPFSSYGGVIADNDRASEALLAKAVELGRQLGAHHIELRQGDSRSMSWPMSCSKVTMEVQLPGTIDDYCNQLSPSRRKKLRYGLKRGLRAEWGGSEAVSIFYKIFATNMRNLGTPVYPKSFFDNQMRYLGEKTRILSLWDGATPVAASFVTAHLGTLELPWAASLPESRRKEAPMLMYWALIQKAIENGFRKVDLGRCSPGGGTYEFKRHWNPVERPLHWYHWPTAEAAATSSSSDSQKIRLATTLWKRLPLIVANSLGPRLVRSIP